MITLNALNEIPLSEFVEKLKDKFEHSPWVAQRVGEFRPFSSRESLYERMAALSKQRVRKKS